MDNETVEKDVVDIDFIDPIGGDDVVILKTGREDSGEGEYPPIQISNDNLLGTGNILSQFFNVIAQIREKEFWKLDDPEIKSLNNTCPKILPKVLQENGGIIKCVLSLLGIIIKRLKMERRDAAEVAAKEPELDSTIDPSDEQIGLTGGRND